MRINPFSRPKAARGRQDGAYFSDQDEDIAVARLKKQNHNSSGKKRASSSSGRKSSNSSSKGRDAPPQSPAGEDTSYSLSFAGGSSLARTHTAGSSTRRPSKTSTGSGSGIGSNNNASASSAGNKTTKISNNNNNHRGRSTTPNSADTRSTHSKRLYDRELSSSPEPEPTRGRTAKNNQASSTRRREPTPDARKQNQRKKEREVSASPDPMADKYGARRIEANGAAGCASKASSRRSKAASSRTYSLSDSEDSQEEENPAMTRPVSPARRRHSSMSLTNHSNNERRGRSPRRERFQPESFDDADDEYDEDDQDHMERAKVISRRRSRSRDPSPSSVEDRPPPARRRRSSSNRSRHRQNSRPHHLEHHRASSLERRPYHSNGRCGSSNNHRQHKMTKTNHKQTSSKTTKNKKSSWGRIMKNMLPKNLGKKEMRQDYEEEVDVMSETEEDMMMEMPRRHSKRDAPEVRDRPATTPSAAAAVPAVSYDPDKIIKVDENYVVAKKKPFANLYEYDNFPAIDRVPTAIGYHSDESDQELFEDDDNKSFTSRYSIDVKSVRSSKLKKKRESTGGFNHETGLYLDGHAGDFSHDEHDDKYAQYLAGAESNAVLSDSSESCPPTWHPVLDADDSDWYDEDEAKKASKERNKHKKYQVSGKEKKRTPASERKKIKKAAAAAAAAAAAKGEKGADAKDLSEEQGEESKVGDAIVANRSLGSDLIPSSKVRPFRDTTAVSEDDDEDDYEEDDDDDMTGAMKQRRRKATNGGRKGGRRSRLGGGEFEEDDDSSLSDASNDETTMKNRKMGRDGKAGRTKGAIIMNGNIGKGKRHNAKVKKEKAQKGGIANKFKGFRRGGRDGELNDASSSDESSEGSENFRLAPSQSLYSEDPSRRADPSLAQLEEDERKESTATHNMIRNIRKEIAELDELDEASVKIDPQASCSLFPFDLAALTGTACFLNQNTQAQHYDEPLDGIQIQRLRDAKQDLENKPKVEVILQDLQDPLAEKYDQLERMQRKQMKASHREKEAQQEIEKREREELLRMKREMRETEQKKLQMAQNKDLTLQEAPALNRGKNQSFVMDITDWVLQLDNDGTPRRKSLSTKDYTPRTNGKEGSSSPIEKLPFNTIEVPTATMDSDDIQPKSSWRNSKRAGVMHRSGKPNAKLANEKGRTGQKKNDKKKKGWFRR